jgi:hypothetical protein
MSQVSAEDSSSGSEYRFGPEDHIEPVLVGRRRVPYPRAVFGVVTPILHNFMEECNVKKTEMQLTIAGLRECALEDPTAGGFATVEEMAKDSKGLMDMLIGRIRQALKTELDLQYTATKVRNCLQMFYTGAHPGVTASQIEWIRDNCSDLLNNYNIPWRAIKARMLANYVVTMEDVAGMTNTELGLALARASRLQGNS